MALRYCTYEPHSAVAVTFKMMSRLSCTLVEVKISVHLEGFWGRDGELCVLTLGDWTVLNRYLEWAVKYDSLHGFLVGHAFGCIACVLVSYCVHRRRGSDAKN